MSHECWKDTSFPKGRAIIKPAVADWLATHYFFPSANDANATSLIVQNTSASSSLVTRRDWRMRRRWDGKRTKKDAVRLRSILRDERTTAPS